MVRNKLGGGPANIVLKKGSRGLALFSFRLLKRIKEALGVQSKRGKEDRTAPPHSNEAS